MSKTLLKQKGIGTVTVKGQRWVRTSSSAPYKITAEYEGDGVKLVYWGQTVPPVIQGAQYEIEYLHIKSDAWGVEVTLAPNPDGHGPLKFDLLTPQEEPEEAIIIADDLEDETAVCVSDEVTLSIPESSIEQVSQDFKLYQYVLQQIVSKSDYQEIGSKSFLKKSGFRKLATAFQISTELLSEEYNATAEYWKIVVRATLPTGRYADGVGICEKSEKNKIRTIHDTYATAYTRATNRAIADLIGMGQVSAEEVSS